MMTIIDHLEDCFQKINLCYNSICDSSNKLKKNSDAFRDALFENVTTFAKLRGELDIGATDIESGMTGVDILQAALSRFETEPASEFSALLNQCDNDMATHLANAGAAVATLSNWPVAGDKAKY